MQRYLHVRGKPGVPVSNPRIDDPLRMVGQRLKSAPPPDGEALSLMDYFEPCEEVLLDHNDLEKPIRNGSLILLGKVGAPNLEKAREHFARASAATVKVTGRDDKKGRAE